MLRARTNDGVSFVSVIEPHGDYNPTLEYTIGSHSAVKSVSHFENGGDEYILIETKAGERVGLGLAGDGNADTVHTIDVNGTEVTWTGPYKLFQSEKHKNTEN